jgi:hypothetical protein
MTRILWGAAAALVWASAVAPVAASPVRVGEESAIGWRLLDRFRLFDRADDAARLRAEALLNRLRDAPDGIAGPALRPHYDQLLDTLHGANAESLRRSNWRWARTTDEAGRRVYEPDYLYPRTYRIEARLSSDAGGSCRWSVQGEPLPAQPCEAPVVLALPGGPIEGRWGGRGDVAVVDGAGRLHEIRITVEDRLIVAMGDSFISGEGNPDVPSVISPAIPPGPAFQRPDWPETAAARPFITPAEWWDEPCHRSLLSWPVLAGLWFAARDEQRAVTLVHVGCSGAEEDDGLNIVQVKLPGGGDEAASQAEQVQSLLAQGPGRPIDRVLMSLGGNDVGFVPVINYAVLPPNGYGWGPLNFIPAMVVGGVGGAIPPYRGRDAPPLGALGFWRQSAQDRLEHLPARLERVAETFTRLQVPPDAVTHTLYPDILRDDRGDYCRTVLSQKDLDAHPEDSAYRRREAAYRDRNRDDERGGFESVLTELPGFAKGRTNWNFQFQYSPDYESDGCDHTRTLGSDSEVCKAEWVWTRLNATVAQSRAERGWRIADAHVVGASGHGWCVSPTDSLRMPVSIRTAEGWTWSPESPAAFAPYREDLGRWFRTTNDSVRTQWASPERMIQGTIHPTFNMHIAYAEAVAGVAFAD